MKTETKKKKSKEPRLAVEIVSSALSRKIEESDSLRCLIEKAFTAGRSQTSWEQFKKDNSLK